MEKGFDLLNLQRVVDGATFDNLTSFIMKSLMEFGGLSETNLANKLVSFGVDKIVIFQDVKNGFIAQIMQKHAPFCEWCALHGTSHKYGCSDIECFELGVKD